MLGHSMSKTNETRHMEWQETCKCQYRLDTSVCNNKQRWNDNKCRCECKKFLTKDLFGILVTECECDRSCDIDEYLDYENSRCRKKLVDKFVEECTKMKKRSKTSWNNFNWRWK